MNIHEAIGRVIARQDLSADEMRQVMSTIMTGEATGAQIGGFLVGLRMKGETVDEIAAAAGVMRELATPVKLLNRDHLVDTCGTGGDGANTFNISTAVAFVTAAAGAHVAKHGNRSISSKSGSADVLEAAGVKLDLDAAGVARCVDEIGVGFMFAPAHHGAMKHAIGPRRELGQRSIFNVLGPLTNPAAAPNQVLGVFSKDWVRPLAEVLQSLGSDHVMVVHAEDGLDEISIAAPTNVAELRGGNIREFLLNPEDLGLKRVSLDTLAVESAEQSLAVISGIFAGDSGPARDIVIMNAAAAIYVAGLADNLVAGRETAAQVIDNGLAAQKLAELIKLSNDLSPST